MSKRKCVEFEKQVAFGENVYWVVVYSSLSETVDDITVEICDASNSIIYTYETQISTNSEDRYINSIHDAVKEYIFRQYQDIAALKLYEWDGNIK